MHEHGICQLAVSLADGMQLGVGQGGSEVILDGHMGDLEPSIPVCFQYPAGQVGVPG